MNEQAHFKAFKSKHRMSAVTHIERPSLTTSNGNGHKMQENAHLPDNLPWRMVWRERLRKVWAKYVVTKSTEGRYSISQPLALSILGFILVFGGAWYWRSSDKLQAQHDEIISLRTQLAAEKEKNTDQDNKISEARATAQIADRNAARLEGKFDQFSQIYSIGNPKKNVQPMQE